MDCSRFQAERLDLEANFPLSPALLAISPLGSIGATPMVLFAAASTLSIVPPLVLALVFQRFITRLNIVDPITTRDV